MAITKKISTYLAVILSLLIISSTTGCGKTENNSTKTESQVDSSTTSNYITLGSYKHVIENGSLEVTDEEIDEELDMYLAAYADSANYMQQGIIEENMLVNMNYTITFNNEDIEGEEGSGDFIIGADDIVPGLDEQLIGLETGYIGDFEVTFSDDDEKYPGEKASVQVTINYINGEAEFAQVDDEFVSMISNGMYDNVDGFKAYLKELKQQYLLEQYGNEALSAIIENSEFKNIDDLCAAELENTKKEAYQYGVVYNMDEESIWQIFGCETEDEFNDYMVEYSEYYVKEKLVVQSLAEEFGVEVTDDEKAAFREEAAEYYTAEEMEEYFNEEYAEYSILREKVLTELMKVQ